MVLPQGHSLWNAGSSIGEKFFVWPGFELLLLLFMCVLYLMGGTLFPVVVLFVKNGNGRCLDGDAIR